ncbi:hypothetical protein WOLCODRAFT_64378 [Wolfiporia cocos MD-104 SS10]|uniref:Cytochrome P450 n=1 Tax=Wolfiporia cocos (strain MD-104) TaxID=742152 RepID=A0A2H3JFZ9_WOLCO|nr:hypothetical protein WOLCODRAFT_64378 [Wolfiporia cocos MD-104 SS10]
MTLTTQLGIAISVLALWYILRRRDTAIKRALPFPPGPPPKPLIGNVLQIPIDYQQFVFTEWAHTYGDLIYLRIINKPLLVLSSAKAAFDLMDKRSAIYSDRPHATIWEDL